MIAICIESSQQRGMGHFYRALNLLAYFKNMDEKTMIIINQDEESLQILKKENIIYEVADYNDVVSNWEKEMIQKYGIEVWLLDKFQTKLEMAEHIKSMDVLLAAIDDSGAGADLVDLNFCSMTFRDLRGKKIYKGKEYMVLNPDIVKYRRYRTKLKKILVTMGGSDTYGVTIKVVRILKQLGYSAHIIIGPNFKYKRLLEKEINDQFVIYNTVPSLIKKFYEYDLAITGGGVTCFEANSSGLPCMIIANEQHEIDSGKYLESFGGAKFIGYYKDVSKKDIHIEKLNISEMSKAGLKALSLNGIANIYNTIQDYRRISDE